MAETIKIGGELESTATGNVVAAASAIKDKVKNKYQSEINDDVARHETEIHGTGGIDSRVTDLEAMEQIVIDGGDAQIATGSDFTNPDATKRAKIPTVGAIVDGLNDGVYDVSKRNPTAGPNSDGKFTLDYILSNADTLIPTGWRHGGMTISFASSSDNKYVQYRYMGTDVTGSPNPFLDTDNWQGVDNEPTANSDNLVKSGGVYDFVNNIPSGSYSDAKEFAESRYGKTFQYILISDEFTKPIWYHKNKFIDAVGANINLDPVDMFVFKVKLTTANQLLSLTTYSATALYLIPDTSCDYTIDWGDGSAVETVVNTNPYHQYSNNADDIFTIKIHGYMPYFKTLQGNVPFFSIDINTLSYKTAFGNNGASTLLFDNDALLEEVGMNVAQNALWKASMKFGGCSNLEYISNGIFAGFNLDTANQQFTQCSKLKRIPLSFKDAIQNCTNFSYAFFGTSSIEEVDYTMLDKVEDGTVSNFSYAFYAYASNMAENVDAYEIYTRILPKAAPNCVTAACFAPARYKNIDKVPTSWGGTLSE